MTQPVVAKPVVQPFARSTTTSEEGYEPVEGAVIDLALVTLNATVAEGDKSGESVPAYEVVLSAVWPEALAPMLLGLARGHVLKVQVLVQQDVTK